MLEIDSECFKYLNVSKDYTNMSSIERVHCDNISYAEFFSNFMLKNVPIILTSISKNWHCNEWTRVDEFGVRRPNFPKMREEIPNIKVPVANCSKPYFNSHEKSEMNFHNFLNCWERGFNGDPMYLKDWHLRNELPNYNYYSVPKFFASDWLNEILCDGNQDDYKFVYMGPKGTWTSFHSDVFSSFSWSTNILGQKKWLLLVPGEENKLRDKLRNLPFSISQELLEEKNVKFFSIIQEPGEAIFVPSGWYHQVHNLEDTISINHNWFNGTQIYSTWTALENSLFEVIKEISDCRDMENFNEHCQVLLRASFGINIQDFLNILQKIVYRTLENTRAFEGFTYGQNHLQFDLVSIDRVLKEMLLSPSIEEENSIETIHRIRGEIKETIDAVQ